MSLFRPNLIQRRLLSSLPWFVDQPPSFNPSSLSSSRAPSLPEDTPNVLRELHSQLARSPHLEQSELQVTRAIPPEMGQPLPLRSPQGKRRRGGTYAGESMYEIPGTLWNWMVFAQVKEGTENKGAIESVVRIVRKSLLAAQPPLPLPPNSKRRMQNGWAMIDAGDFAVHVISRTARERYFNAGRRRPTSGVDVYPGVANPTASSDTSDPMENNFVNDPTSDKLGAGAGANFEGHRQAARNFKQTAGVCEGRPGIIESTHIEPLNDHESDDEWANTTSRPAGRQSEGYTASAASKVSGAVNKTYEVVSGKK